MRKTFLFVETDSKVEPPSDGELGKTVKNILSRGVVVKTPVMIGLGVILGDNIITSLFLVGNFSLVSIWFSKGKKTSAFVVGRDEKNNLAKLRLADIKSKESPDSIFGKLNKELISHKLVPAGPRAIGDPLFVANSRSGVLKVKVAAMFYGVYVDERWENSWRINSNAPVGLMGSGIWDEEGQFMGVSLASRVPSLENLRKVVAQAIARKRNKELPQSSYIGDPVYAAPANAVLDFVETK
ncbi:MAG: hypothetical protein HYV67_00660 [Candidatus Taylorbacteria bacterium]|nr:hypothetical protein [Candidatus Taylorbacteria bacterium]